MYFSTNYSFSPKLLISDVRWNEAVGNLNEVKQNERLMKSSWVKFKQEEVKCRQV
jgi:hypothetical protein